MDFSTLRNLCLRDLGENVSDTEASYRVSNWINEIIHIICQRKGIKGLLALVDVSFPAESEKQAISLGNEFNANSRMVEVHKAILNWSNEKYLLYPIDFSDYLEYTLSNISLSRPSYYALHQYDSNGNPYLYLYPTPSSTCTVSVYGRIEIGDLSSDDDIVYPVGSEDVIVQGVRWLHSKFRENPTQAVLERSEFEERLRKYKVQSSLSRTYIFGGSSNKKEQRRRYRVVLESS